MLKKFGLVLLLSTTLAVPAPAICIIEQAMHNIEFGAIQLNADYARQMKPMLGEMEKLMPKNGSNGLPAGLQMSPQASRRFEKMSFDVLKLGRRK